MIFQDDGPALEELDRLFRQGGQPGWVGDAFAFSPSALAGMEWPLHAEARGWVHHWHLPATEPGVEGALVYSLTRVGEREVALWRKRQGSRRT